MKIFSLEYIDSLVGEARNDQRLRRHRNIHSSYNESCQRLFNAIEPDSYIRPHRHSDSNTDELLIAIRGLMAVVIFTNNGDLKSFELIGRAPKAYNSIGVEVSSNEWHTVLALETGCVLLEVKEGPFDPDRPKEFAKWAPCERSESAITYLNCLRKEVFDMNVISDY